MTAAALNAFRLQVAAEQESLFPCTLNFGGDETAVPAATAGLRRGTGLIIGGQLEEDDIVFRVRKSLLDAMPEPGTRLAWVERTMQFRIQRVTDGGDADPCYLLTCQSVGK